MNLQDALLYWAQIKTVAEARQDDRAALDTLQFFETILSEDHHLSHVHIAERDDEMVVVHYQKDNENMTQRLPVELVEQLLADINANPKYNNC